MKNTLVNPSSLGANWQPGQEPEIAEGVRGIWFDRPDAIYLTFFYAVNPGNGDVSRMLDALPPQRMVIVPTVLNERLRRMLLRRGFQEEVVGHPDDHSFGLGNVRALVRTPPARTDP